MEKLLSFEVENEKLEIHLNEKGIDFLIDRLNELKQNLSNDHLHLFSKKYGGKDLSADKQNSKSEVLHNVKILFWE